MTYMQTEQRDFVVSRVQDLPPSPTIAVAQKARELRRQGMDVVDFGPGEPDFDTPQHIKDAAIAALQGGLTHYAPGRGIPDLLDAISEKLHRENGLEYDAATEIIVTTGAKQAILEAVLTAVGPGDEVILLDPTWGSYDAMVQLAGGRPVHVQSRDDFTIDPHQLRSCVSGRTRMIVIGSPGNPTGYVFTEEEMDLLAEVCRENDLLLISDEIYERIVYSGVRPVSPASLPGMRERTITINGFSKAYAMTGWRLGYAAGPKAFMHQMLKVQEHSVTSATAFAQMGAVAAIRGPQEPIQRMVGEFARRRELVVDGLNALPGVTCLPPHGAFYVFPNVSGTGQTGTDLANHFLKSGVALTPGIGFGDAWDTHVRISFATSEERIRTGLERIATALSM